MGNGDFFGLIESHPLVGGRFERPTRLESAAGFFSMLFRAKDLQSGRDVVLKFFDPNKDDPRGYRSTCFARESQVLSDLVGQRNILQLVSGEETLQCQLTAPNGYRIQIGLRYYATERAEGSLSGYIYGNPPPDPRESLVLFREVCKGVQRLHARGLLHRDLKPTNCLRFEGNVVKLADFGTAKRIGEPPLLPDYNVPVGDWHYAAPELVAGLGNFDEILRASDIFGLGAILFELFTGHVLTNLVYNLSRLQDLNELFARTPLGDRQRKFHQLLPSITARWTLPDVQALGTFMGPASIRDRVNTLYRRLADLDYRRRFAVTFESVFRDIESCLIVLAHDKKVAELVRRRKMRALARAREG